MISTLIFDLDGTLLNTLPDIADAMNRALGLHGLPQHPQDAYRMMVGNGARKLAERAAGERQDMSALVLEDYQAWYEAHCSVRTCLYPGMEQLLEQLAADGMRLCVLSNKPDADAQNVVRHYLPAIPWTILRGQLAGVPVKPAPDAVHRMLEEMGARAEECLFVGDSSVDIQTARNAGIRSVGVSWGFRGREELTAAGADHIIDEPGELRCIIAALNAQ